MFNTAVLPAITRHGRIRLHLVRRCVSKNVRTGPHD
jgi:hypothetical protein